MSPSGSSRWCPTPEQLMILEELYRSGVRTPNSSQIQRITAHLSLYGKIEGKNVFYWFQNHKARDRQKLRRKLIKQVQQQQQQQLYHHHHHDNQLQKNQSNYSHHHLLNYFDPSAAMAFHQLSYHNSSTLPLVMGGHDIAPTQMMNYQWKAENPLGAYYQMGKSATRMYDHDWMMMVDVGPPSPCCTKPIKTLELFPITATNLKDECSPSSKHL